MTRSLHKYSLFYAILLHLLLFAFLFTKFANHHHYSVVDKSSVKIINAVAVNGQQVERKLQQIKVAKRKKLQAKLAHIHYLHEQALAAQHKKVLMQQREVRIKAEHLRKLRVQRLRTHRLKQLKAARAKDLVLAKQQQAIKLRKQRELVRRTALQRSMQQQLIQEHRQMLAVQAARMQAIIDRYKALIVQAISQYWVVPSNLAHGVSCQLLLNLAPGGVVLGVVVVTSSTNATLDRSAQTAVWKASPLPVPKDPALFANFRAIKLTVRPVLGVRDED